MYKKILIFVISILIALFLSYKIDESQYLNLENKEILQNIVINNNEISNINVESNNYSWSIEIPKINLLAEISEGSDNKTLSKYVGHIINTGITSSNICLCGHTNTGNYTYGNFYFDKLKDLSIGDYIYYNYLSQIKKFIVREKKIVDENDISVLSPSEDTKLTLITCVKGQYYKRLCVSCDLVID